MSKLITTKAERDAKSYLDWDDASLGRLVKKVALDIEALPPPVGQIDEIESTTADGEDMDGLYKASIVSAVLILLGALTRNNHFSYEAKIYDHVSNGVPIGDWKVTATRMKDNLN